MASGGLGSQYGAYNPAAVDPYPIESVLAPLAAPDTAQAQSLLHLYQSQREANANIYGQELDKQHDFNRQQLHQQLIEAQMKNSAEYAKLPGGARFASQMPGSELGGSPEAWAQFANQSDQAQQATNLQHSGAGTSSYSTAGYQLPGSAVQGITGLPFVQGTRPDITIQGMKDASKLASANISAGGKGPKTELTTTLPIAGDTSQGTLKTSGLRNQADIDAARALHTNLANQTTANRTGGSTSDASGTAPQLDTNSQTGKGAQQSAMKFAQIAKDAAAKPGPHQQDAQRAYNDISGNMKGPVYTTVQTSKGPAVVGKSGAQYNLGAIGQ